MRTDLPWPRNLSTTYEAESEYPKVLDPFCLYPVSGGMFEQSILYAITYADLEALLRSKDSGVPMELFSAPITDECVQVIIELDEYPISPSAMGYGRTLIK